MLFSSTQIALESKPHKNYTNFEIPSVAWLCPFTTIVTVRRAAVESLEAIKSCHQGVRRNRVQTLHKQSPRCTYADCITYVARSRRTTCADQTASFPVRTEHGVKLVGLPLERGFPTWTNAPTIRKLDFVSELVGTFLGAPIPLKLTREKKKQ